MFSSYTENVVLVSRIDRKVKAQCLRNNLVVVENLHLLKVMFVLLDFYMFVLLDF